ncbi:HDL333Wp [Eremothecium sinecaudum]|uniref:Mediator of RNA polymerase II transcription subunit 10 n=1 Tax=Eremothecium sinecaudum TaxID=45286 RepID=A0A0X8HR05_9SACH|nr:HDL333Wp [Eremothecium sinecaudum]AMD20411.1 HDL333Wp [Eremothecium sinecaudum]
MDQQDINKQQASLSDLELRLASIIESFIELGVSVYDFPGTQESTQGMVTNLKRNVERIRQLNQQTCDPDSPLKSINIPLEVLQYIEDGRNPDVYTREFVEAIRRSNQYQRAKMHALRKLRDSLADKISEEFPDLEPQVQSIIERANGSSGDKIITS